MILLMIRCQWDRISSFFFGQVYFLLTFFATSCYITTKIYILSFTNYILYHFCQHPKRLYPIPLSFLEWASVFLRKILI